MFGESMKALLVLMIVISSALANAEVRKGQISVLFDSEEFGSILIQGNAAKLIYEKMKVEEKEHAGFNTLGAFAYKTSLDGTLNCEKYKDSGRVDCRQFFTPSTGVAQKYQNGHPF